MHNANCTRYAKSKQIKKQVYANAKALAAKTTSLQEAKTMWLAAPNPYHLIAWITPQMAENCRTRGGEEFSEGWFY